MDRQNLMDRQSLFDVLTMRLSAHTARRDVLRTLGQFVLAMVVFGVSPWQVLRTRAQGVTPQSQLVKGCKLPGQRCNNGRQDCCAKKCTGQKRCGCINKGGTPDVETPLGPVHVKALCCSNKLNKRRGTCK